MSNQPLRVAISYSHDSSEHLERVFNLANDLRARRINCWIDQFEEGAPQEGWPRWSVKQIEESHVVLVVCTKLYRERFQEYSAAGGSQGATFEGSIITNQIFEKNSSKKFPVILFSERDINHVPLVLVPSSKFILLDGDQAARDKLYRHLANASGSSPVPVVSGERRSRFEPAESSAPRANVPDHRHFGGNEWAGPLEILQEVLSDAMVIAQQPRFVRANNKPNIEAVIKAVRHNLSPDEVARLYEAGNLDRFVDLLDRLKKSWLDRLKAEPRVDDVEQAYSDAVDAIWNRGNRKGSMTLLMIAAFVCWTVAAFGAQHSSLLALFAALCGSASMIAMLCLLYRKT